MKGWFVSVMATFALLVLPLAGCSGSSNGGTGGTAGAGGTAGSGGTAGAGGTAGSSGTGGAGGTAGTGGLARGGGDGGSGGNGTSANQSWSGSGDGEDGPFTICLTVNEDGSALVFDGDGACSWSFAVVFESCDTTPDEWARSDDIPIVNGDFSFSSSRGEINGTFVGDTASGDVRVGSCNGSWTAMPDR